MTTRGSEWRAATGVESRMVCIGMREPEAGGLQHANDGSSFAHRSSKAQIFRGGDGEARLVEAGSRSGVRPARRMGLPGRTVRNLHRCSLHVVVMIS